MRQIRQLLFKMSTVKRFRSVCNRGLIFAGEESGGMITGPEALIQSQGGRTAIAMREKSAGESMVLVTALAAHCKQANMSLSDYLAAVFTESQITATCDVREDITYYNESEPNPEKLRAAKLEGEAKRDKNDLFFLGIAIALRDGKIEIKKKRALSFQMPCQSLISQHLKMFGLLGTEVTSSFVISLLKSESPALMRKPKPTPLVVIRRSVGNSPKPSVKQAGT